MDFPFSSLTIAPAGKQPPLGAAVVVVVVAYMQNKCVVFVQLIQSQVCS